MRRVAIKTSLLALMLLGLCFSAFADEVKILDLTRPQPLAGTQVKSADGSLSVMGSDSSVTTRLVDGNLCIGTYSVSKRLVRIDNVVNWLTNSEKQVSESIVKIQITYKKCDSGSPLEGARVSFVTPEHFPLGQIVKNSTTILLSNGERGISQTQYVFNLKQ